MKLEKNCPCKVNLLLNILGKRPDGFHELETLIHPVPLWDRLSFSRKGTAIELTCSEASLPADATNLVHRTASAFMEAARVRDGIRIHLEKQIPLAAGLGGGSANAAITLLGLNELFGTPLTPEQVHRLAASLGSDVPFFLQAKPALATGRGENIEPLDFFPALRGAVFLLIHPGFGVPTAWAYQQLARFPSALAGQPGRARKLAQLLRTSTLATAARELYNSLEAPVLEKYPLLAMFQDFFREQGMPVTLMSGSGSTTFTIAQNESAARQCAEQAQAKFGRLWTAVIPV